MSEPLNPYAAPQSLEETPLRPGSGLVASRPYVSARFKTGVVVWASAATILCQIVVIGSFLMQLYMLYAARGGTGLDPDVATSNDLRQQVLVGCLTVAAVTCLIALWVWVYATHANLSALGASSLEFSSGWAVGWFFVPIANLVKPYQAVHEIWEESQPNPLLGRALIGAQLVGWWWGLRIVSAISERVLSKFGEHADTIDSLIFVSWTAIMLTLLIDTPLEICQILMVRRVQKFQDERYELIAAQQARLPAMGDNPFAI